MIDIDERLKEADIATHALFDYIFQDAREEIKRLRSKVEAMERQGSVGVVESMPGTSGFTMACFSADEVPVGTKLYALPGAQPSQSVKDAIIDDLQSQFDTEGITENDSGDALIRLSDAIAAVEDNFAQPAPSIPEGWKLVPIVPVQEMSEAGVYAGGIYYDIVDAVYEAMVNIAPEYKP